MPYIAIKGFPKDDAIMCKVAEQFNKMLLELWGADRKPSKFSAMIFEITNR